VTCGICQDSSIPADEFYALHCQHWFCGDCWRGYMYSKIADRAVTYCCPHPDCPFLVTSDMQSYFCSSVKIEEARSALIK
jgi:ariadne-1